MKLVGSYKRFYQKMEIFYWKIKFIRQKRRRGEVTEEHVKFVPG